MSKNRDKEWYAKNYPNIRKWLNICTICQTEGYKPDMPEDNCLGLNPQNIRRYWKELEVNEFGVCNQCSKYLKE